MWSLRTTWRWPRRCGTWRTRPVWSAGARAARSAIRARGWWRRRFGIEPAGRLTRTCTRTWPPPTWPSVLMADGRRCTRRWSTTTPRPPGSSTRRSYATNSVSGSGCGSRRRPPEWGRSKGSGRSCGGCSAVAASRSKRSWPTTESAQPTAPRWPPSTADHQSQASSTRTPCGTAGGAGPPRSGSARSRPVRTVQPWPATTNSASC